MSSSISAILSGTLDVARLPDVRHHRRDHYAEADEQRLRERDLRDDESLLQPRSCRGNRRRGALQHLADGDARRVQRG